MSKIPRCLKSLAILLFLVTSLTCATDVLAAAPASSIDPVAGGTVKLAMSWKLNGAVSCGVGGGAVGVAAADFNADGKLDLVKTNYTAGFNSVSVMLGNGDGTFQSAVSYAAGVRPNFVMTADMNGDGKPDILTSNYTGNGTNDISTLLGNGNGTFQAHRDFSSNGYAVALSVADFNNDGKLDVVASNANAVNAVSVLIGNGDGTLLPVVNWATGSSMHRTAVGDFNGDGNMDIATANIATSSTSILLGNGNGTFQPHVDYAMGASLRGVDTADLNGDGKLDLAVASRVDDKVYVTLGNGDGTFQAPVSYAAGTEPQDVMITDLDADGIQDLVVTNRAGGNISVLLGNGDGSFKPQSVYATGSGPIFVTKGDFNLDGRTDIAAACLTSDYVSVFIAGGRYSITGTATDGSGSGLQKVEVSTDGGSTWNLATGTDIWSYSWDIPSSYGSYTIMSRATDNLAQVETPGAGMSVTVDSASPASSITSPTQGQALTGTSCVVSGTASDTGLGVLKVEVSTDGGANWTPAADTSGDGSWSTWSFVWPLSVDGSHTIVARATDNAGNVGSPGAGVTVTVDNTVPTGYISINHGAAFTDTASVTLTPLAFDSGSGVAQMQFSNYSSSGWSSWQGYSVSAAWELASGDGPKTVYARYKDTAGHISAVYSDSISLESTGYSGQVWSMGLDDLGQNGGQGNSYTPAQANGLTGIVSVANGMKHSVALKSDGTVWTWGSNNYGQLGIGIADAGAHPAPAAVPGLTGVMAVAAGYNHTLALKSDGTVWGWGLNDNGQLGDGTSDANPHPAPVQANGLSGCVSMTAWENFSMAVKSDGTLWTWGNNTYLQLGRSGGSLLPGKVEHAGDPSGFLTGVVMAAGQGSVSMAVKSDGTVWTWGSDISGQLGRNCGVSCTGSGAPGKVEKLGGGYLAGVVQVAGGNTHGVALLSDGTVWTWGLATKGRLGRVTDNTVAGQVTGLSGVTSISTGYLFSLAVKSDGTVWSWGDNQYGQLGQSGSDKTSAGQALVLTSVGAVSGGGYHTTAIKPDDSAPASGSVNINSGAAFTGSASVTLALSATDTASGVAYMQVSNDGVFDTEPWAAYATGKSWTLTTVEGLKTVSVRFRDAMGNVSSASTDTITLDKTAPASGSVNINSGVAFTGSVSVTLALSATDTASGVAYMQVSNDGIFDTEPWEAYATGRSWTLLASNGQKAVYVRFRDAVGNVSPTLFDTIKLDTVFPVPGSVNINSGATFTGSASVTLTLSATDAASGVADIQLSNDGVFDTEPWEAYATGKSWTLTAGSGLKTVYVRFRDAVGNVSSTSTDTITLDTAKPSSVITSTAIGSEVDYSQKNSWDLRSPAYFWETPAPYSVASADFNGDGKPDLAAALSGNDMVSVRLGNGDMTFADYKSFGVGKSPRSVVVGDFNNDGSVDIATANAGNNTVSVCYNNGAGSFPSTSSFTAGTAPVSIAAEDFNRDGFLDLATANSSGGNVSVLLNDGTGNFPAKVNYAAGSNCMSITSGDFNGDGKPDLAVCNKNSAGSVTVLLNNGNGTFATGVQYNGGANPVTIAAGDFTGDGVKDLAIAYAWNTSQGYLFVWRGVGNGTFQPTVSYAVGPDPRSISVSDFNQDGRQDIAAACQSPGQVSVLLQSAVGQLQAYKQYSAVSGAISVAAADFNRDGVQDLAVANYDRKCATVLKGVLAYTVSGASGDGTGSGVNKVEVSANGGSTWTTASGTTSWSCKFGVASTGNVTVISRATDNAGNVETPGAGLTTLVDTTPPTSAITYPAADAIISKGQPVTVTGTAGDAGGSGVRTVEVSTDLGNTWDKATDLSGGTWSTWQYVTSALVRDCSTPAVMCRAVDNSGRVGGVSKVSLRTGKPVVTRVTMKYIDDESTEHVLPSNSMFLDGVPLSVHFMADVNWNGNTPGSVTFTTNKGAAQTINTSGSTAEATFNVGSASSFGVGGSLMVAAASGSGQVSDSTRAQCFIISNPAPGPLLTGNSIGADPNMVSSGSALYNTSTLFYSWAFSPLSLDLGAGVSASVIPPDLPGFGGKAFGFLSNFALNASVSSAGRAEFSVAPGLELETKIAGQKIKFVPALNAVGNYKTSFNRWDWGGRIGGNIALEIKPPAVPFYPMGIPLFVRMKIQTVDINMGIVDWTTGPQFDGDFGVNAYLRLSLGVGVSGVCSASVWGGGGAHLLVHYPTQPHLKDLSMYVNVGVTLSTWLWEYDFELYKKSWKLAGASSWSKELSSPSVPPVPRLTSRDYLNSEAFGVFHERPELFTVFGELTPLGVSIGTIQSDVFPRSAPSVSSGSADNLYAAWLHDDTARFSVNRTEAVFSKYNGSNWAVPAAIEDDGTPDFYPFMLMFPDGTAAAAWQDCDHALADLPVDATPEQSQAAHDEMQAGLDITAAVYDPAGGIWSASSITANGHLDVSPMLAGTASDDVLLVWRSNPGDDMFGSSTDPNEIWYSKWNGSVWAAPQKIADIARPVRGMSLAYNGTSGMFVIVEDTDGDGTTQYDQELYAMTYDGSSWTALSQFTDDSAKAAWAVGSDLKKYNCIKDHVSSADTEPGAGANFADYWEDSETTGASQTWAADVSYHDYKGLIDDNPQVAFNGGGQGVLTWLKGNEIRSVVDMNLAGSAVVTATGYSSGAADFKLARSLDGRIALVWPDSSDDASQSPNLFAAFYDPASSTWGTRKQMTSSSDSERYMSVAFLGVDQLVALYNKDRIGNRTETYTTGEGDVIEVQVPYTIGTDLCYMTYTIGGDLAIQGESLVVDPPNPAPGTTATITATVVNLGEVAASGVTVGFYSSDPSGFLPGDISAGGALIGMATVSGTLASGYSQDVSISWSVPAGDQPITVYAVADPAQTTFSGDEDKDRANDSISRSLMMPDLAIQYAGYSYDQNGNPDVSVIVANNGSVPSAASDFIVKFGPSSGATIYISPVSSLAPGGSQEYNFNWDVSALTEPSQTLYLAVDDTEAAADFDRNNNSVLLTVAIARPNATLSAGSVDFGSVVNGLAKDFTVTLTNTGNSVLELGAVGLEGDTFSIASGSISGVTLAPSESRDVTVRFAPVSSGEYAATLTVPSNDPDSSTLSVSIMGEGAPPDGSIMVDGGEPATNSTSVTLTLSATGDGSPITDMQISDDGVFDTETWESYATTRAWDLPAGDGDKTVYARFRDAVNESAVYSDTITLDTAKPTSTITGPADAAVIGGATYAVTAPATDGTGSGVRQVEVGITPVGGTTTWYAATGDTYEWTLPADGGYGIQSRATDNAGNVEVAGAGIAVTVDNTAPTVSAGADVTSKYLFTQTATASDAAAMTYLWEMASGPGTVVFGTSDALSTTVSASADGPYVIRFTATDVAGNSASDDTALTWDSSIRTTSTALSASPNPVGQGLEVTLTATVSPSLATGTVTFMEGEATVGDGTLSGGAATCTTASLTAGTHWITASYGGDSDNDASASSQCAVMVTDSRNLGNNVWSWGYNASGQLGDGANKNRYSPVSVPGVHGVSALSAGYHHTLALNMDGTVWAWGYNGSGELGTGTPSDSNVPVQVSGLDGIVAVSAGAYYSTALKSDGTVWAWGDNGAGQLGDGTTLLRETPTDVSGITGVVAIASGFSHTLALKSDGTVWAWGNNASGQLGDGSTMFKRTPVQVTGLAGVTAIAAGDNHSMALKDDGTVVAWGYNRDGQLGDGTTTTRKAPVNVSGLGGVTAIACGSRHSMALMSNGTVWAWGNNATGALGDGSITDRKTPVLVGGLGSISSIACGGWSSLALGSDGRAWAWGFNADGELGDGTVTNRLTPVRAGYDNTTIIAGGGFHTITAQKESSSPVSEITAPADGGLITGLSCDITGTAGDGTGSGVSKVEVSINGGGWVTASGTSGWTYTWSPPADGGYTIRARATDAVGNVETPDAGVAVTVDATDPASSILTPADNAVVKANISYTITGTAADVTTGVRTVEVSTDGGATWHTADGTTSWSYDWPIISEIGIHGIMSRSTDNAGNIETPGTGVTATVTVYGNPELPHYNWDAATIPGGADCTFCHATWNEFLASDYMSSPAFCYSCHNSAGMAHDDVVSPSPGQHSMFVNATAAGRKRPTYGNITAGEINNIPASRLIDNYKVGCTTCHNVMKKSDDPGLVWSYTTTTDRYTYTLQGAGWAGYGNYTPKVYRDTTLWGAGGPSYSKTKKQYLVNASEYNYNESTGVIIFKSLQDPASYVYVTMDYPYLRAPETGNALCSDCHNQLTHQGINCMNCHQAHNTSNLKGIREKVRASNFTTVPVRFINYSLANSFADGDGTHDGICEVCHVQTLYHKRDGSGASHNDGTVCTSCHSHAGGFAR